MSEATNPATPPNPTAPAPQPNPAFQAPPTGAPGGPPIPPTIPLTVEEYQRLRGLEREFDEFRAARQRELDAKETERIKALADKGEVEKALQATREQWEAKHAEAVGKYQQLRTRVLGERKAAVMADAFTGFEFIGETPEQAAETASMFRKAWDDEFEAAEDAAGNVAVREKATGLDAKAAIRNRLSGDGMKRFLKATRTGGSGAAGTAGANPPGDGPKPGSFEELLAAWQRQQSGQHRGMGLAPVK